MTDLIGDRAVATVEEYGESRRPFLLSLHFSAPHWPWEAPGDEDESKRIRGGLFHYDGGSAETYARMVGRMDYQVGRLRRELEKTTVVARWIRTEDIENITALPDRNPRS